MIFDKEDEEIIKEYLIINKNSLKNLSTIKSLKKEYKKELKNNSKEFHDDIEIEFFGLCKMLIAQDVGKNTGLATDGIMYLLDYMGLKNFKKYIGVR